MKIDFTINLNQDNEWAMDKHHFHEHMEILLSLSDAGNLFANDKLYPLNKGSIFILNDTTLHKTIANQCDVYQRYVVHFTSQTLKDISTDQTDFIHLFDLPVISFQLEEDQLKTFIKMFEDCRRYDAPVFGNDIKRNMAFLDLLLATSALVKNKKDQPSSRHKDFDRISPILKYIKENLNHNLSLEILAQHFFMNKYHLSRLFKSATGFSLMAYIINCRILKSRELLRQGHTVQEAGEGSGFNNNAHFIRTFGKHTGISPGKYMRTFKDN